MSTCILVLKIALNNTHPFDFDEIGNKLFRVSSVSALVNYHSLALIENVSLLVAMQDSYGLKYKSDEGMNIDKDSVIKSNYCTLNRRAKNTDQPNMAKLGEMLKEADFNFGKNSHRSA